MQPTKLSYLPQLDGLRALAIVMVFLHHSLNIPLLWSGVDLFFVLSGYLITNILLRDAARMTFGSMLRSFYIRRAERILPAYVLFLLVACFFVPDALRRDWPYYVGFLQNIPYAFHNSFNALVPLWSLAIEQHFYLFWPALVFFLPKRMLAPAMLAFLFVCPVLRAVCTPLFKDSTPIYALTPFRLDAMALGALAALRLPGADQARTRLGALLSMALGVVLYVALAYHHPWFTRAANSAAFNGLAYTLNLMILGGLFVYVTISEGTVLNRLLSNAVFRWLARISYSFYLFHLLVLMTLAHYLGRGPNAMVSFAVTSLIATLSWFLLEKPVLSWSASHRKAAVRQPA